MAQLTSFSLFSFRITSWTWRSTSFFVRNILNYNNFLHSIKCTFRSLYHTGYLLFTNTKIPLTLQQPFWATIIRCPRRIVYEKRRVLSRSQWLKRLKNVTFTAVYSAACGSTRSTVWKKKTPWLGPLANGLNSLIILKSGKFCGNISLCHSLWRILHNWWINYRNNNNAGTGNPVVCADTNSMPHQFCPRIARSWP
jgi:hypothetical protein